MPLTFQCPACGRPYRLHAPYPMPGTELKCACGLTIAITFPPGMVARLRAEGASFVEDLPDGRPPPGAEPADDSPPGAPSRTTPPPRAGSSRRGARRRPRRGALALLLMAGACTDSSTTTWNPCDVTLTSLDPGAGRSGVRVQVFGTPFTDAWDTAVYVGSARATVISLDRTGCEVWDECIASTGCNLCDDCDACDPHRFQCQESVLFSVPTVASGEASVQLFNRRGKSNALVFTVEPPASDTAPPDTADTAPPDTAPPDTAPPDTADTARTSAG